MEEVKVGQEIPQQLMYRHTWEPFWTCPWDLPVSFSLTEWQFVNKLKRAGPSIIKIFSKHGCAWWSFLSSLYIHIKMGCLTLRFKFNKVCKTKHICYDYGNVRWLTWLSHKPTWYIRCVWACARVMACPMFTQTKWRRWVNSTSCNRTSTKLWGYSYFIQWRFRTYFIIWGFFSYTSLLKEGMKERKCFFAFNCRLSM